MVRKSLLTPPAKSAADWLDRTGTNQAQLVKMIKARGIAMTAPQMSDILRKAKPCRLATAIAISEITGVPVQKLVAWGKAKRTRIHKTLRRWAQNETSGADAGGGV
jgi:hypothetical protein